MNRRFFTAQAQITGPVFNRIWDTPDNGYAEKFKHSIEPTVSIQRTSSIDNFNGIVKLDGVDYVVGGIDQRHLRGHQPVFREAAGRARAARHVTRDLRRRTLAELLHQYRGVTGGHQLCVEFHRRRPPSNFSPIALSIRAVPNNALNASFRAEFDSRYHNLRTVSATGSYAVTSVLQTNLTWSKAASVQDPTTPGIFKSIDQSISAKPDAAHQGQSLRRRLLASNYDIFRHSMLHAADLRLLQHAVLRPGVRVSDTTTTAPSAAWSASPSDRRFFLSFTLAGLGNFSPFNGAMSGVPR